MLTLKIVYMPSNVHCMYNYKRAILYTVRETLERMIETYGIAAATTAADADAASSAADAAAIFRTPRYRCSATLTIITETVSGLG